MGKEREKILMKIISDFGGKHIEPKLINQQKTAQHLHILVNETTQIETLKRFFQNHHIQFVDYMSVVKANWVSQCKREKRIVEIEAFILSKDEFILKKRKVENVQTDTDNVEVVCGF